MIGWGLEALVASALLMAAVLALRGPVRRAWGARIGYALWALPVLRLLLPPLPATWHRAAALPIVAAGRQMRVLLVSAAAAPAAASPVSWPLVLGLGWAAGALALVCWQAALHGRFRRRVLADAHPLTPVDGIATIASRAVAGPLAFGVIRRWIAVPLDWADRFTPAERTLALAHERAHHARGDLLANWIALFVLALHWFNPLAWAAYRAFRADQEMATDAAVLADRGAEDRAVYAAAIVKAAAGGSVRSACHLNTLADLKRRLTMVTLPAPSGRRRHAGAGIAALLGTAALIATASGMPAAARLRAAVRATPDVPVAPLPPAAPIAPAAQDQAEPTPPRPPVPPKPATSARTIIVRPGKGQPITMMTQRDPAAAVAAAAPLVGLPADFTVPGGCKNGGRTPPEAYVIKGQGDKPYTVICTRSVSARDPQAPLGERDAYQQALAGLHTARVQIQQQVDFPEAERSKALAAVDESITELEADLARAR